MDKTTFTNYCEEQLKKVFEAAKEGKPDNKLKHRTEGIMLAGEMLNVICRDQAKELIEKAHFDVFGENLAERTQRKKAHIELKETSPDEYFDIPAIERRK